MSVSFIVVHSDSREVYHISWIHKSGNSEQIPIKIGPIPKVYGVMAEHVQDKEHTPGQKEIYFVKKNCKKNKWFINI